MEEQKHEIIDINHSIVQANALIKSISKLDLSTMKIFEMAVSCIDTSKGLENNRVIMKKKDILNTLALSDTKKYTYLNQVLKNMVSQGIEIEIEEENGVIDFSFYAITTYINYKSKGNPDVILEFNPKLLPYLIDLKENFTQYKLREIIHLSSKYAVILYKWLMMNYQQGTYNPKFYNPKISMKDLRKLTDTEKEFSRFGNFEKKVLQIAKREINSKTQLRVSYDKIKDGRNIAWIQFYLDIVNLDNNNVIEGDLSNISDNTTNNTTNESNNSQNASMDVTDTNYERTYGKYENVFLTDTEINEIIHKFHKKWAIEELSEWKHNKKITRLKHKTDMDMIKNWNKKRTLY